MWFWMYDTQIQGSRSQSYSFQSRFSAVFIGFPGGLRVYSINELGFYGGFLEICGQNWSTTMLLG